MESVLSAAKAAASFIPRNMQYFRENQKKSLDTIRYLDENIHLMDYSFDYGLDKLLEKGVANTGELVAFCCNQMTFGKKLLDMQDGEFACTTFNTVNRNGEYLLGRNFDFVDAPCMLVWTHPENGYKSLAVADSTVMLCGKKHAPDKTRYRALMAPYCCMDGINEKGLSIAVLELKAKATAQKTGKKPITTTVIIRAVLDKAANVEEAIELFRSYDMQDAIFCAYHYQITDATGRSVILEYDNNELVVVEPKNGRYQWAANFYLTMSCDNSRGFGYDRADAVRERLAETDGVMEEAEVMALLEQVHLNYKHKRGYQITTLWSAVYNNTTGAVTIAGGMDYTRQYRVYADQPMHVEKL